jgi:hypothetical protein
MSLGVRYLVAERRASEVVAFEVERLMNRHAPPL